MNVRLGSLLFSAAIAAPGCGSGGPFATDPGESVLVENTTAFAVAQSGVGYGGLIAPAGAPCTFGKNTYTVHLDTSKLEWDRCDFGGDAGDPAAFTHSTGSRVLSAADLETARSAARMVHVSGGRTCGADKPEIKLTVTSPAGSQVYADDFYACLKLADVYVISAELDALTAQLRALDQ